MPINIWYIDLMIENPNKQAYLDLINDIKLTGNGIFNCTLKINDGFICDQVVTERINYVDPSPSKAY